MRKNTIFFESERVQVLAWLSKSPDLNPVENFFAELGHIIYQDNRQFGFINELWIVISEKAKFVPLNFYEALQHYSQKNRRSVRK